MSESHNEKIPFFQVIYVALLFLLMILRARLNNMTLFINLVNYISMVISIASTTLTAIFKIQERRRRNVCKSIFVIIIVPFIVVGFIIFALNINTPSVINDIFTLIALMFCICNKVFEFLILKVASCIKS